MTARNEREAHWLKAAEAEPSWKTEARRASQIERRHKRRDGHIWLLLAALVLLICSAWWIWLT